MPPQSNTARRGRCSAGKRGYRPIVTGFHRNEVDHIARVITGSDKSDRVECDNEQNDRQNGGEDTSPPFPSHRRPDADDEGDQTRDHPQKEESRYPSQDVEEVWPQRGSRKHDQRERNPEPDRSHPAEQAGGSRLLGFRHSITSISTPSKRGYVARTRQRLRGCRRRLISVTRDPQSAIDRRGDSSGVPRPS